MPTLCVAIWEAKTLESLIEQSNDCQYDADESEETDETIVHKPIGVLRKRVLERKTTLNNEHYAPDELSIGSKCVLLTPCCIKQYAGFKLKNLSDMQLST